MPAREHDRSRRRRRGEAPARRPERARRASRTESGGWRVRLRRGGAEAARAARAAGGAVRGGLARRARSVPSTGGAFRMATTRRAAMLALVICALALSLAVPLRTYFDQRAEMRDEMQRQEQLRAQVQQLEDRQAQLSDPTQVEAEVRRRLGYVRPGETPYVVQLPDDGRQPGVAEPAPPSEQRPTWYAELWRSINGGGA
jgi:cell division protein FtsB